MERKEQVGENSREEGELSDDGELFDCAIIEISDNDSPRRNETDRRTKERKSTQRKAAKSTKANRSRSIRNTLGRSRDTSSINHAHHRDRSGFWERTRALRWRGASLCRSVPHQNESRSAGGQNSIGSARTTSQTSVTSSSHSRDVSRAVPTVSAKKVPKNQKSSILYWSDQVGD